MQKARNLFKMFETVLRHGASALECRESLPIILRLPVREARRMSSPARNSVIVPERGDMPSDCRRLLRLSRWSYEVA
jgi:hypothetical protein